MLSILNCFAKEKLREIVLKESAQRGFRVALKMSRLTLKVDYLKKRIQVDEYVLSKYMFWVS